MDLTNQVALVTGAGQGIGRCHRDRPRRSRRPRHQRRHRPRQGRGHRRRHRRHPAPRRRGPGRRRRPQRNRPHGARGARHVRPDRHPGEQRRRYPPRRHHGPHRGGLGAHPPRQRQGRVLLPPARRARDDPAPQRAHHQHRLDRRQRLRRRFQCRIRGQQGRGDQHDPDSRRCNSASTTSTSIRSAPA